MVTDPGLEVHQGGLVVPGAPGELPPEVPLVSKARAAGHRDAAETAATAPRLAISWCLQSGSGSGGSSSGLAGWRSHHLVLPFTAYFLPFVLAYFLFKTS